MRATTLSPSTLVSALRMSSASPSQKNSFSASLLMFAIEGTCWSSFVEASPRVAGERIAVAVESEAREPVTRWVPSTRQKVRSSSASTRLH